MRAFVVAGLIGLLLLARTTDASAAVTANATQPNQGGAAAKPGSVSEWPATTPAPAGCEAELPEARSAAPSDYVVALDADTLWRPIGSVVRFTVRATGADTAAVKRVMACFRWEPTDVAKFAAVSYLRSPLVGSALADNDTVEYRALIPDIKRPCCSTYGPGTKGRVERTGLGLVPLADMQVLVELQNGTWFEAIVPVGITRVWTAYLKLAFAVFAAGSVLWLCAPKALLPPTNTRWAVSRRLLAVISTSNGVASLSQFQLILWCFVVGGAAVYVMSLSGNLIDISDGTLTLLGIAGGASVLARVPPLRTGADADAAAAAAAASPPVPPPPPRLPRWSDLLVADPTQSEIDVTRVQMLIFTLISATFVVLKVALSYSIPEIPNNFLLLMGISNGVYLAGRHIPNTPKGGS